MKWLPIIIVVGRITTQFMVQTIKLDIVVIKLEWQVGFRDFLRESLWPGFMLERTIAAIAAEVDKITIVIELRN